jgi:CBS-domain-containing membrane protein
MPAYLAKFRGQAAALPPRAPRRHILLAALGGAVAIALVAALAAGTAQPLVLGSLGASCVFVFGLPDAPFAQPRNVIAGHVISSASGLVFLQLLGPSPLAVGLALGTAIALMFATRTVHAPAGSNPVIVFLTQPGWGFLLAPTLLGAVLVVAVGVLYNNAVRPGRYPLYWIGRDAPATPES